MNTGKARAALAASEQAIGDLLEVVDMAEREGITLEWDSKAAWARQGAKDTLAAIKGAQTEKGKLTPDAPGSNMLGGFGGDAATTARKAALGNYPRSGTQRWHVLQHLARVGDDGATSDEIADTLHMNVYSVKPRLIELRRGGWAVATGSHRRSNSDSPVEVYRVTAKGRRAVDEERDREAAAA